MLTKQSSCTVIRQLFKITYYSCIFTILPKKLKRKFVLMLLNTPVYTRYCSYGHVKTYCILHMNVGRTGKKQCHCW